MVLVGSVSTGWLCGLYLQQRIVGFGFVGSSTAAISMSLFGSEQMFTLLLGRSLIARSTPPCFILWLRDGLTSLWISYPRMKRTSSGLSFFSHVSVRQRMSYINLAIWFATASRLLKSRRLLRLAS